MATRSPSATAFPLDHRFALLYLNCSFPRQSGTIMSGFASTLEAFYLERLGYKKGWHSGDRFHER